jgi:hypothetical protein
MTGDNAHSGNQVSGDPKVFTGDNGSICHQIATIACGVDAKKNPATCVAGLVFDSA